MLKSILVAAAVAATAVISTGAAEAKPKVNVDIFLGGPGYYYDPGYGYYDPPVRPVRPRPVYDYEDDYGVSCRGGAREVRHNGFRDVRAIDCDGRRYRYKATRYGRSYIVTVSSRSGEIIAVDRRRRY
jgi:hypothetical protein